jgi:hypothetical protein
MLSLHHRDQVLDDGAGLLRVVRSVGDDRRATGPSQRESLPQLFGIGGVERLACYLAIGCRKYFGVEIAQPHIDHEGCQTAPQHAVAREERNVKRRHRPGGMSKRH